ncbi:MAG: hypothetical protein CSA18_02520 [Deltaproteobacteria bacterium]|nr:MAG: hypothetical protein CSB21_00945 [Deltaproteobacteria bacterium]PIE75002.1 MAG: hypothetical protein CSA18_02520 [Deltaproteobacteria bacterium]
MKSRNYSSHSKKTSWIFLTELEKIPPHGQKYHIIFPSKIEVMILDFVSPAQSCYKISIDNSPLEFSFYLAGSSECTLQSSLQKKEDFICTPDSSLLTFLPETQCKFHLAEKQPYRILNIYIPPEIFWEKFENQFNHLPQNLAKILKAGKQEPYNQKLPMSCHLRTLVEQLFQCPYRGIMQQLYLEAKTMEIIIRHLWELARRPVNPPCQVLGPSEKEQIHWARDMISCLMILPPPSLDMLARAVGMNPNKLNQGFRKEFGTTVFAWYRMTRIQKSCEILEQGLLNIDEAAQYLGFYDTPHFIRHFKQYFGKTPGKYLKERRI